jgi:hypothetical protein
MAQAVITPEEKTIIDARTGRLIVRRVTVIKRAPKAALEATGRNLYFDKGAVKTMSFGQWGETDVTFFSLGGPSGRLISDDELDEEYALRDLKAADPFSLAAVNEADPAFADDHSNGTHWKDRNGNRCFATFYCWGSRRDVSVRRGRRNWDGRWWYAGVPK